MRHLFLSILILLTLALPLAAQEVDDAEATAEPDEAPASTIVEIEAADGATLYGEYFAGGARKVLLLHQMYADRTSWTPLIYPLLDTGYSVLAVDLRGLGDSRRAGINWHKAQDDTQQWIDWLAGDDPVLLVGSSIGSSLALMGCADAPNCAGAVAISPGMRYYGVNVEAAVSSGKPVLIVYAEYDRFPRRDVPLMLSAAEANDAAAAVNVITIPGRAHGMAMFDADADEDLTVAIIGWLAGR